MLTEELRATRDKIVRDHFQDEIDQHWDDVLSTFPHPRYELIATGDEYIGDAAVRGYYNSSRIAFPDQRGEIIQLRHSDDAVIVEFFLEGTHLGPFGAIPATGSAFKVRMTAFFLFDGEELTCERIYFDVLTLLKQLIGGLNLKNPKNWWLLLRAANGARKEL